MPSTGLMAEVLLDSLFLSSEEKKASRLTGSRARRARLILPNSVGKTDGLRHARPFSRDNGGRSWPACTESSRGEPCQGAETSQRDPCEGGRGEERGLVSLDVAYRIALLDTLLVRAG